MILSPVDESWAVLKRFRGEDERRKSPKGGKNLARLIDPRKPDLGYKDKPGGPEGKPYFDMPPEIPRDNQGSQGNLPHKWLPENNHIVDLSDYPTPESHQSRKLLEKILGGRMVKKVTHNKERGTKDTEWIDRREHGTHSKQDFGGEGEDQEGDEEERGRLSTIHQNGLSHHNEEALGRQALKHLHDLGLDAARVRGHIFINVPNIGRGDIDSPMHGAETDSHTFYMPVSNHKNFGSGKSQSWPQTIGEKYDMGTDSDPHNLRSKKWSSQSTGRRSQGPMNVQGKGGTTKPMHQNHFIDDINLINPYHSSNILSDPESHKNPEGAAKAAFEKDYWTRRDAEQKRWQEENMSSVSGLPRVTGKAPPPGPPDAKPPPPLPQGMLRRIQDELRAMQRWWEDPNLKAKDIKKRMPHFWNFANIQWSDQAKKMPKKWWKLRAKEVQENISGMAALKPPEKVAQTPMVTGSPLDDMDPSKWKAADPSDWTPPEIPDQRRKAGFRTPTGEQTPNTVLGRFGAPPRSEGIQPNWDKKKDPPRDEKGKPLPGSEFEGWDAEGNIIWRAEPLETAFDVIIKFTPPSSFGGHRGLQPITQPQGPPPPGPTPHPDESYIPCANCGRSFPIADIIPMSSQKQGGGAIGDALRAVPENQRVCRPCRQLANQDAQGMTNYGPGVDASKDPSYDYIYTSKDRPRHSGMVMVI